MTDYTWPSIYFAYLFFALSFALALFFFIRSFRDAYWGEKSEDVKYQMFDDVGRTARSARDVHVPPRRRRAAGLAHAAQQGANNVPR